MYSPYEWSPICKTYGIRYKLDEEGHFVVQRIGVDIEDKDKIMAKTEIECCPQNWKGCLRSELSPGDEA